jgi:hypothetical protein
MAGFEDDIAKEIADILRQHVAAATKPLKDRIAELERCVKEIELRGELNISAPGERTSNTSAAISAP